MVEYTLWAAAGISMGVICLAGDQKRGRDNVSPLNKFFSLDALL